MSRIEPGVQIPLLGRLDYIAKFLGGALSELPGEATQNEVFGDCLAKLSKI